MAQEIKNNNISMTSKSEMEEDRMPRTNICRNTNHPNLWSDNVIQSLSSPYGMFLYVERRQNLVEEVDDIFNKVRDGREFSPFERIWFVDVVQRLGIDRYFQEKINVTLDYIYKHWNESVIDDLNISALGFRTLRLNRYNVSADVFQKFKDEKGYFFCFRHGEPQTELSSMLSLYRASELDFPGENILQEARAFTSTYLQEAVKKCGQLKEVKSPLLMEVEYVLKYPWRCSVPRWEARNYIEIFRRHNQNGWIIDGIYKMPSSYGQKLLELAILDFNILQYQHQTELKQISTWWKNSSASQLDFLRHRHVEYYFWLACSLFEPEFSTSRIGFTKLVTNLSLIDDIYDTYGTFDELKVFTAALIRWDISIIKNLPDYMKTCFEFTYEIHNEIASEAEKKHGPFVHKYIQDCWKSYIISYLQEAEWKALKYVPTFDQYLTNGTTSSGMRVVMIHSLILTDTHLSDKILEQLDFPLSKFQTLVALATRLVDDMQDFEDEKSHGEMASSIQCYINDNHGSTTEDALNYLTARVDSCMQELNIEFLKSSDMPTCCKNIYFNAGMRGIFFLYKDNDGITFSHQIKDAIIKILMEPVIPEIKSTEEK